MCSASVLTCVVDGKNAMDTLGSHVAGRLVPIEAVCFSIPEGLIAAMVVDVGEGRAAIEARWTCSLRFLPFPVRVLRLGLSLPWDLLPCNTFPLGLED
jgi:hypothetical protein